MCGSSMGGLEPMLVNVDLDMIAGGTRIVLPNVALAKAHFVEHLRRQPGPMIGEAFGIAEVAVHQTHAAVFAAHIPRRAAVTQHGTLRHQNGIARRKAPPLGAGEGLHHGILALDTRRPASSCLARTSAMRASTSARVISSCSTTRLRSARIHFS